MRIWELSRHFDGNLHGNKPRWFAELEKKKIGKKKKEKGRARTVERKKIKRKFRKRERSCFLENAVWKLRPSFFSPLASFLPLLLSPLPAPPSSTPRPFLSSPFILFLCFPPPRFSNLFHLFPGKMIERKKAFSIGPEV